MRPDDPDYHRIEWIRRQREFRGERVALFSPGLWVYGGIIVAAVAGPKLIAWLLS